MPDLLAHIQSENDKAIMWMAEEKGRMAGMITEDLTYWAECGVYTPEQFDRNMLVENVWDLYKSVSGIRPRHVDFDNMPMSELQEMYDGLLVELEQNNIQEAAQEVADIAEFEARMANVIASGAGDRKTALRWMMEADDSAEYEYGLFEYSNGLPYGYLEENV